MYKLKIGMRKYICEFVLYICPGWSILTGNRGVNLISCFIPRVIYILMALIYIPNQQSPDITMYSGLIV